MADEGMRIADYHRHVPLFGDQSEASMEKARRDIDAVFLMSDIDQLVRVCREDRGRWSAESRLWAFSRLKAQWEQAAEKGRVRPDVSLEECQAAVCHLGTSWHRLLEKSPPRDNEDE